MLISFYLLLSKEDICGIRHPNVIFVSVLHVQFIFDSQHCARLGTKIFYLFVAILISTAKFILLSSNQLSLTCVLSHSIRYWGRMRMDRGVQCFTKLIPAGGLLFKIFFFFLSLASNFWGYELFTSDSCLLSFH